LGDPDAQNDLGFCYANGEGVKKDMKKAAKYYRLAAAQGSSMIGNSWIYKKKYDE
jgi:TPR repeat protein